jgi:hypothetical protein
MRNGSIANCRSRFRKNRAGWNPVKRIFGVVTS